MEHSSEYWIPSWEELRSIGAGLGKIEARVENDVLSDSDIQDE